MVVRGATVSDFPHINSLRAQRTNISRPESYFSFLEDNPAGKPMIWVAYEEERLVGYLIAVPHIMQEHGRTFLSYMVAEAVVVQDLEGTGIYKALTGKAYASMAEQGAVLRYEYPYGSALYAQTNRLGATYIEDIPVGIKIFSFRKHLKGRMRNQWLASIMGQIADWINRPREAGIKKVRSEAVIRSFKPTALELELFWTRVAKEYPLCIHRSCAFLSWRLQERAGAHQYHILGAMIDDLEGYVIYKVEERRLDYDQVVKAGYIMDLVASSEDIAYDLLSAVEDRIRQDVDFLALWMPREAHFESLGQQMRYRSTRLKIAMVGDFFDESYDKDEWLRAKNWHIMPLDADLY